MNTKNPNGPVGYRTPTEKSTGPKVTLPKGMSKGQALIARAQLATGDLDAQFEDLHLNRRERRVIAAEAKEHRRGLARRDALKKQRADKKAKKFARGLVEL